MKTYPIKIDDALWARLTHLAVDRRVTLKQLILEALTELAARKDAAA